jgi:hypothetical protein
VELEKAPEPKNVNTRPSTEPPKSAK